MKKIFTLLSAIALISVSAQEQTLIQYSNPDVYNDSTPLCQGDPGEPVLNHNGRVFDLASYGITGSFTLTKADVFGTGSAGITLAAEAAILNNDGDPTNPDNFQMTDAYGIYSYGEGMQDTWVTLDFLDTHTFEGGSKFAVAISYEFVNGGARFYMGNNDTAQNPETSPSYIGFPNSGCVNNEAMDEVAGLGFPVSWLFSITGEVEGMGTVELGSKSLSVYPNPATDVIHISMKNGDAQSVEVVNLAGQSVYSAKATNSLNVSFLPAGVYIVRVKDANGVTHMSKIVKK